MSAIGNTSIVPFIFEGEAVRVVIRAGKPWFVAIDVASALGYAKPENAVGRHCKLTETCPLETGSQVRHVNVIPEPDVYRLIIRSNLPSADPFEKWLFEDVLPSLRRTGSYTIPGATVIPPAEPPEQVRDLNSNLRTVTETRQTWGVKSAQQMGLKLGMPTVPAMFEPQQQPTLFDMSGQGDAP